jgi:hypothetical protein
MRDGEGFRFILGFFPTSQVNQTDKTDQKEMGFLFWKEI